MRKILKRLLLSITLLSVLAIWAMPVGAEALFGYQEFEKSSIGLFPQWVSVLKRHARNMAEERVCEAKRLNHCDLRQWLVFLDSIRKLPPLEQIKRVNHYANKKTYVLDSENYGVADYWATPREFLLNGGDCEDYAIIKMLSLKWLGFDVNRMRIVIVQDTNLNTAHAVMSIEWGGDILILDNQIPEVLSHTKIYHYVPIYSINEKHWWMHVPNYSGGKKH